MNVLRLTCAREIACLFLVAVCCLPGCADKGRDVIRPFAEDSRVPLEAKQVGDTFRFATQLPLAGGGSMALPLAALSPGRFVTHVALDGIGPDRTTVILRLVEAGDSAGLAGAGCEVTWEPSDDANDWRPCALGIARKHRQAELVVQYSAGSSTSLWIASPIVVSNRAAPKPPTFIVMMDTARFDVFDSTEKESPVGENFAELARDAILISNLRASSSWTRTSVATLLTGLSPSGHAVFGRLSLLPDHLPTLQSELQRLGYATTAWSSNPNILPMWGFGQGFDSFVDVGALDWAKAKADASTVFQRVRTAVRERRVPSILHYIHLMDPHAPYLPSEEQLATVKALPATANEFPGLGQGELREVVRNDFQKYTAEVFDLDQQLGAFTEFLQMEGLYDSALIIVVSDHGEEFLDHGGRYHGKTLYEEMLRVPGLIKLPGNLQAGTTIAGPVGLIDIFPTVLDALGTAPPDGIDGASLLHDERVTRPHVSALSLDGHHLAAVTYDGWKLISDYVTGEENLFELVSDPGETVSRLSDSTGMANTLRLMLDTGAVRQSPGWHVRVCGCPRPSDLDLTVIAEGGEVVGRLLEDEDILAPDAETGGFGFRSRLSPRTAQRETLGKLRSVVVIDEDELVVSSSPDAPLTIRRNDSTEFEYALGTAQERSTSSKLVFDSPASATTVPARQPVSCSATPFLPAVRTTKTIVEPCAPYLRVWHVPPAAVLDEEDIDPVIVERLKALGYTW